MPEQPPNPLRQLWKAIASLALCAALATLAVNWVADQSRDRIAANLLAWETRTIADVLPGIDYDNEPSTDSVSIVDTELLGTRNPLPVYRARRSDAMIATVFTVIAPDGYVGPIKLLVAIRNDHSLIAVRAMEHRETPGLGDQVDAEKSDWIAGFSRFDQPLEQSAWQYKSAGGQFDKLTGASVTSRAVINAVRNAVELHRQQFGVIASSPSGTIIVDSGNAG